MSTTTTGEVLDRIVYIQRILTFLVGSSPILPLRTLNKAFDETICDYSENFWHLHATRIRDASPSSRIKNTLLHSLAVSGSTGDAMFFRFRQAARFCVGQKVFNPTAPFLVTDPDNKLKTVNIVPLNYACLHGNVERVHELLDTFNNSSNNSEGVSSSVLMSKNPKDNNNHRDWIRAGQAKWWSMVETETMPLHEVCRGIEHAAPPKAKTAEAESEQEKQRARTIKTNAFELARYFVESLQHPVNVLSGPFNPLREAEGFARVRRTPLAMAAGNGHVALVRLLLQHGGADAQKLKSEGDAGLWPIHFAARSAGKSYVTTEETIECLKLLLEHGRTVGGEPNLVDKVDDSGNTPLNIAVKNQNYEVVRWLVEVAGANVLGPSVGQGGSRDWQPLSIACSCPPSETNAKIVDLLLARGANSSNTRPLATNNATPVYLATNQAMRAYDERGPRPRVPFPLQLIVLQKLLQPDEQQAGGQQRKPRFDPNLSDKVGQSPLYLVCSFVATSEAGLLDQVGLPVMKLLLESGANPHGVKRDDGWTPFLKCCTRPQMASLLVRKDPTGVANARLNEHGHEKYTAVHLYCATQIKHKETARPDSINNIVAGLRFLVEDCGCDVNAEAAVGETSLTMLFQHLDNPVCVSLAEYILYQGKQKPLCLSDKDIDGFLRAILAHPTSPTQMTPPQWLTAVSNIPKTPVRAPLKLLAAGLVENIDCTNKFLTSLQFGRYGIASLLLESGKVDVNATIPAPPGWFVHPDPNRRLNALELVACQGGPLNSQPKHKDDKREMIQHMLANKNFAGTFDQVELEIFKAKYPEIFR